MHTEELNQVALVNLPVFIHTRGSAKQLADSITQIVDNPTKEQRKQMYNHRVRTNGLIIMAYSADAHKAAWKIFHELHQAGVKNVFVLKVNPYMFDSAKALSSEALVNKLIASTNLTAAKYELRKTLAAVGVKLS